MDAFLFTLLIWVSGINPNVTNQTKVEAVALSNTKQTYITQNTSAEKNCTECHGNLITKKVIHPSKENCKGCHQSNGNKHPQDNVEGFILLKKVSSLCYNCHDLKQEEKVLHKPVTDGNCLNCHNAHQSDYPKLLLKDDKELCLSCHNKTVSLGTRKIANIKQLIKKGNFVHSVIDSGGCSTCHSPHASNNSRRLVKYFPGGEEYLQASADSFALCFSCHDSKLFEEANTQTATKFRNGDENLHYVHVNRKKSRNCSMCHNIHGSVNKHLINHTVMFGNWEMPMDFKWNESGGSCNNGCHAEKKYDRIKKVIQKSKFIISNIDQQKEVLNENEDDQKSTDKQIVNNDTDSKSNSIAPIITSNDEKIHADTTENVLFAGNKPINKVEEELSDSFISEKDSVSSDMSDEVSFKNINFVFAKAELIEGMEKILLKLVDYLTKYTGVKIEIYGHTDNVGSDAYNNALATKRAEKLKKLLMERGVNHSRIQVKAFGETKPIATNKTAVGRAKNRRVEFKIIKDN